MPDVKPARRGGPAASAGDAAQASEGERLILEHEMGEFFKVIALTTGQPWDALGFVRGDKTHRL